MGRLFAGGLTVIVMLIAWSETCCYGQVERRSPLEKFQRDLHKKSFS